MPDSSGSSESLKPAVVSPPPSSKSLGEEVLTTTIDGDTYVITEEFLDNHPGGRDMLKLAISRDSSALVASYHRRDATFRVALEKLPRLEGEAAKKAREEHYKFDPHSRELARTDSPLYTELKRRVNEYFAKHQLSSRGGGLMLFKTLLLLLAAGMAYYASHVLGYALVTPLTASLLAMIGLCIQHDANHGSLSPSPALNRIFGFMDDVIGGSALCWRTQHVAGHHQHPNHHELDSDSYGNWPLMRLNPLDERKWFHAYQAYYAPFIYSLLALAYPLRDIADISSRSHFHTPMPPLSAFDLICFWTGKVIHYTAMYAVPIALHGFVGGFFGLALPTLLIGGFFLAISFSVSHNTPSTSYNSPVGAGGGDASEEDEAIAAVMAPGNSKVKKAAGGANKSNSSSSSSISKTPSYDPSKHCFAEMQIRTSADWAPDSWISCLIWGGLNTQVVHHLFPGVCHLHYPALTKIVAAVCADCNVPYNAYPTFLEAVTAHLRQLHILGNGADGEKLMGQTRSPRIATFKYPAEGGAGGAPSSSRESKKGI